MPVLKNVELTKKANIYFDGKVTSRSFIDENGVKKFGVIPKEKNNDKLIGNYDWIRT